MYRPPSSDVNQFLLDLSIFFFKNICKITLKFLWVITNKKINLRENSNTSSEYMALLGQYGFCSYSNGDTRVASGSQTCLDHIFLRVKLKHNQTKYQSFIIHSPITDHFPIMLNIFNEAVSASRRGDDRVVTRMDFDKLNNFLKSENWQIVFESVNSDVAFNNFLELYQKHIINSNSVKILKSDTVKKIKPWITVGLVNSIKYRDKLKKQLIKNFNTELKHTSYIQELLQYRKKN